LHTESIIIVLMLESVYARTVAVSFFINVKKF
jgi:hypothetical protein